MTSPVQIKKNTTVKILFKEIGGKLKKNTGRQLLKGLHHEPSIHLEKSRTDNSIRRNILKSAKAIIKQVWEDRLIIR